MIAALFDADGTLYAAQFGRGLLKYAQSHGRRAHVSLYFASLAPLFFLRRLGLGVPETWYRLSITRLTWLLRGWDARQARRAFEWVTDEYLLPTRRQFAIARLRDHQARGHLVIVISATFTPSLEILGQRLGVADLIGTGIEIRDGRYTGGIIPPLIRGADKVEQVRKYVEDRRLSIDWAASSAYGDSYSDRHMLEMVGHPVAVQPDPQLRALAQEQHWEVLQSSG